MPNARTPDQNLLLGRQAREKFVAALEGTLPIIGKTMYDRLQELARWTGETLDPPAIRDELMVRLRAQGVLEPTALDDRLADMLRHHRQKLEAYQAMERRDFAIAPTRRHQRLQHLVLQAGMDFERQRIAFCEEALAVLGAPD